MSVVCLILRFTCSSWFLRLIWSLVGACGLCGIVDPGFGAVLSSVIRAVPGKDMPLSHGKGKKQSFKPKNIERVQERMILQAFTPKAVLDLQLDVTKGEDGHDTDGSLCSGLGEASGRVDVPVGVNAFLSAETFLQVWTVCRRRYPWLLGRENDFCEGLGWEHSGTPGP